MPRTALTDDELNELVSSILEECGRPTIEKLLEHCHEYRSCVDPDNKFLQPHEKYFRKEIVYRDFDLHIRHFLCSGDSVLAADIQFKRPSRFPSPLWNRNRALVAELRKLLRREYCSSGIAVKDNDGGRQIHFNVSSNSFWWSASTSFEQWESECAIYDEPFSSGETDPNETSIRNDFVILRFRRKAA
jgi:hypothetical protein